MTDRRLPDRLHCSPPGALARYDRAVDALLRFDATTVEGRARLREDHLSLDVFEGLGASFDDVRQVLKSAPLRDIWQRCQEQRQALAGEVGRALKERLPVMLAARWVLNGKAPRQPQSRYEAFVAVAEDEIKARGMTGMYEHLAYRGSEGLLPTWLDQVASGHSPTVVTARLAGERAERYRALGQDLPADLPVRVREAMVRIGDAWSRMLEGIVVAHEGEIVAIFHEHQLDLGREMRNLFNTVVPCARLRTRDFSWVAGRVPAILGLFLRERRKGLVGLVMEQERAYAFDAATCAVFLRGVTALLERPELADHVEEDTTAVTPLVAGPDDPPSRLHWQLHGFGTGFQDFGLTQAQLLPALRAASQGQELRPPAKHGTRRARA